MDHMWKLQCGVYNEASVFAVKIKRSNDVWALQKAIAAVLKVDSPHLLDLYLARDKDGHWLKDDDKLDTFLLGEINTEYVKMCPFSKLNKNELFGSDFEPRSKEIHVLAQPPKGFLRAPAPAFSVVALPRLGVLSEHETCINECISLPDWDVGAVHELPTIANFMKDLGGCTTNDKIYWRLEDKQVVSILLDGWFRESTPDNINPNADKRSIVMGSPGVGKSMLLCLMAFYLLFKHQKNVLVYRKLDRGNCLFYLGFDGDKIVQFAMEDCLDQEAIYIYEMLQRQQGIGNVWLLLDGFQFQDIPDGLRNFKMLATSQEADVKEHDQDDAYLCLLPCWSKTDLVTMGRLIHGYTAEDIDARFYYSGGSAREFTRATTDDIHDEVHGALSFVESPVMTGRSRLDSTYVKDTSDPNHFLDCWYWEHVIDSEYAVQTLSVRLGSNALSRIYRWARRAGHASFASSVFRICERTEEGYCEESLFARASNRHCIGDLPPTPDRKRQRRA